MRNELAEIEICCRGIVTEPGGLARWEWDDYIGAFLSTFGADRAEQVQTVCDKFFMSRWDRESLPKASPGINAVAETIGGLRSGQKLFMTRPDQFIMAFGAWWPWGDGETISLRIGLVTDAVPEHAKAEFYREFSGWFTNAEALQAAD